MKTSVEWLEDCLTEQYPNGKFVWNTRADIEALFKRAKEMEKEQMINFGYESMQGTLLGKTISKKDADKDSFEDVTKYKKERSYSDEEVIELLQKALTHKDDGEIGSLVTAQGQIRTANFFSWFEKFKNK